MTATPPNLPLVPGIPGIIHFWDANTMSYTLIARLGSLGPTYTLEDIVTLTWAAICQRYFSDLSFTPTGLRWTVAREQYRDPGTVISETKLDVVVIKLTPSQQLRQQPPALNMIA
ncbi:uncharacterized protein BDZ99DRAFT_540666 [Mytilinidion resinicola]|uniref:Uncharacterized protein n=1 Tax=Mytilinidion resinicola TaxID=574789 RepID=A0A6A6Y8C3_9PEZI|nr:uncharacterized protein BDZ99DRAFT_540666 [Mytilinidion resinicola]KAF2805086.1 hypothetical protein BDZ99DRAFT_540666 [Mytilinidion resinicola]